MFKRARMKHDEYERVWEEQRARLREGEERKRAEQLAEAHAEYKKLPQTREVFHCTKCRNNDPSNWNRKVAHIRLDLEDGEWFVCDEHTPIAFEAILVTCECGTQRFEQTWDFNPVKSVNCDW
jgi:hypothetical protein